MLLFLVADKSVQQSDARLDHILSTTKMLGQSLYFLTIGKLDLPDDQKRQQKGLDYAEVKIERDLLRVERDELKSALAKERELSYNPPNINSGFLLTPYKATDQMAGKLCLSLLNGVSGHSCTKSPKTLGHLLVSLGIPLHVSFAWCIPSGPFLKKFMYHSTCGKACCDNSWHEVFECRHAFSFEGQNSTQYRPTNDAES